MPNGSTCIRSDERGSESRPYQNLPGDVEAAGAFADNGFKSFGTTIALNFAMFYDLEVKSIPRTACSEKALMSREDRRRME